MTRRDPEVPIYDIYDALDGLRRLVARANALGRAAEDLIERGPWSEADNGSDRLERLTHLVGAIVEALALAKEAGSEIATELVTRGVGA